MRSESERSREHSGYFSFPPALGLRGQPTTQCSYWGPIGSCPVGSRFSSSGMGGKNTFLLRHFMFALDGVPLTEELLSSFYVKHRRLFLPQSPYQKHLIVRVTLPLVFFLTLSETNFNTCSQPEFRDSGVSKFVLAHFCLGKTALLSTLYQESL